MAKPFIDFVKVKTAVSFEQVLGHYGLTAKMQHTRNGDGPDGPCPIHPEATGKDTFKVTLSKNCWFCHLSACKCGDNHLDFVAKMENCGIHEAALKIDQWFNLGLAGRSDATPSSNHNGSGAASSVDSNSHGDTPRQPPRSVEEPPDEDGDNKPLNFKLENLKTDHAYLTERGLIPSTVAEFGLGFCSKGTMPGRIVIPIHNSEGELVGYAGRWPGTRFS